MALVNPLFRFENTPDEDYVDVQFSLSGPWEAIERHGFHEPTYGIRQRTATGFRYSGANFKDGLERIAAVMVLPTLEQLKVRP